MRRLRIKRAAGVTYAMLTGAVVLFQVALAAGAPWGALAMGGAFEGTFPPSLRMAALLQAVLLSLMAGVVVSRAGLALPRWSRASRKLVWVVVGIAVISVVLNLITPSAGERALWAPIAILLLASSLVVAIDRSPRAA